jgi:hypothetical protein
MMRPCGLVGHTMKTEQPGKFGKVPKWNLLPNRTNKLRKGEMDNEDLKSQEVSGHSGRNG